MPLTLTTLTDQAASLLWDETHQTYPPALIAGGVRQALSAYNLSRADPGAPPSAIADLDGAAQSTLPEEHAPLLALGAAGFVVLARLRLRSEAFDLNQTVPETLAAWAHHALERFYAGLTGLRAAQGAAAERQRRAELLGSAQPAWAEAGWPLDAWDGEAL